MHARRDSAPHILAVGDSADLPTIADLLLRLPAGAYGQVYLEVAAPVQTRALAAPRRVAVTWLCRDQPLGMPRPMARRGELAARAIEAWVAEWMPEEFIDEDDPIMMWIGCRANPLVSRVYTELSERLRARSA